MKYGNWLPISKAFIKDLPHDRPYTRLEAAYSLQYDYDNNNQVTVAGYAALWSWSRSRVSKFLSDMNVDIIYPETTQKLRNQKGHIAIHKRDINETYNRHIRCIENTYLEEQKDIKKTYKEHKKDISPCTTKEPNPNPNKKTKELRSDLCSYLETKISENQSLGKFESIIYEFFNYRMDMISSRQYKTTRGIDGLIKNINSIIGLKYDVKKCLVYVMEKNWLSPEIEYFEKDKSKFKIEIETIVLCLDKKDWYNSPYQELAQYGKADVQYINFTPDFIDDDEWEEVERNNKIFMEKYGTHNG